MAITRKLLEGMGLEERQVQAIIDAHAETVDGLRARRDEYKEQADRVPDLLKKLEEAKEAKGSAQEWERKFNDEHKAFEDFKTQLERDRTEADKAKAYRGMLRKAGIDPKRLDAIMRVTDLSEVRVTDGKLDDAEGLAEAARKEWADFVLKTRTEGAKPDNPPENNAGAEGADPRVVERLRARHERLFGKRED